MILRLHVNYKNDGLGLLPYLCLELLIILKVHESCNDRMLRVRSKGLIRLNYLTLKVFNFIVT